MDNKDKHLIVNNPNLAVCWLAGTNKQRFINSDVANNVDELVVGNFCDDILDRVIAARRQRAKPAENNAVRNTEMTGFSNLWNTTGLLLLGAATVHSLQVDSLYHETTSLLNICSRTLPFALPNSSDQSKEGGQANILSQGNVSFADSEVEDVLNSDEFEAAFGNNNCAPSGRITFPETQSPVHDAALEEEIDYGEGFTDEESDNSFLELIETVNRNRSKSRSIDGDRSNVNRWSSLQTSTPFKEVGNRSGNRTGSLRGSQFRFSYLAVSAPHLPDPEVGAMPLSPQPLAINNENNQEMNDITNGEEQQIVQPQPSVNYENSLDMNDNTHGEQQPTLSPIVIPAMEEEVTKRPRRKKGLQIDRIKKLGDAEQTEHRKNILIECAPTDLLGPVWNKLNQGKKLSDNCVESIDKQKSHSILKAHSAKQSVDKDIRRLFNKPCMQSSRLNAPFFEHLLAQRSEDMDDSILNDILSRNTVNLVDRSARQIDQGDLADEQIQGEFGGENDQIPFGGGDNQSAFNIGNNQFGFDDAEMPEGNNQNELTNENEEDRDAMAGNSQVQAIFAKPANPKKRSFRRMSTSTRIDYVVDDSDNSSEQSSIQSNNSDMGHNSANIVEEQDGDVVPRKIPRRARSSTVNRFPTIIEESPNQATPEHQTPQTPQTLQTPPLNIEPSGSTSSQSRRAITLATDSEFYKFIAEYQAEFQIPVLSASQNHAELDFNQFCEDIALEALQQQFGVAATFKKLVWFWINGQVPVNMSVLNRLAPNRICAAKSFASLMVLKKIELIELAAGANNQIRNILKGEALKDIF